MDNQPTEPTMDNQPIEPTMDNQPIEPTVDNQLTEPTMDNQPIDALEQTSEPSVRVKLRKGQYIVTFDKNNAGNIDLNFHVDRCLKQCVFNALRKRTFNRPKKPRKLDTVENMSPEQLERKRATRRLYYYNNKEKLNAQVKERYNNDPVYWEKKLAASLERYRRSRENVEKKKPGRKPKYTDSKASTTASDDGKEIKQVGDEPKKKVGRPRKVKFYNDIEPLY